MEEVMKQIVALLSQIDPGDAQAIVQKLAKELGGGEQEEPEAPEAAPQKTGTVSPEGGVAGVPMR